MFFVSFLLMPFYNKNKKTKKIKDVVTLNDIKVSYINSIP